MKIDHEYLKGLLEAFEASEGPQTDINKLKKQGFDYSTEEFLFHMRLLDDRGLICQSNGSSGFGVAESIDGYVSWAVMPLRLTADGHDFLEAIKTKKFGTRLSLALKKPVWEHLLMFLNDYWMGSFRRK